MGLNSIFFLFCFICASIDFGNSFSVEDQIQFDQALQEHIKNFQSNKNHLQDKTINNRARNNQFRRSSEKGKLLHELASFSREFTKKREKRASNPFDHNSAHPGVLINSTHCPFKQPITCSSTARYRTYDGSCNNLRTPLLGATDTPYIRYLPANYNDGYSALRLSTARTALPNVRTISLTVSPPVVGQKLTNGINHLFVFFGQFLTHDMGGTSATPDSRGIQKSCSCYSTDPDCITITTPNDPYLGLRCTSGVSSTNQTCNPGLSRIGCMSITRSSTTPLLDCSTPYKETLNLFSAYIDGSVIYGESESAARSLRTLSGGLLRSSVSISGSSRITGESTTQREYLPLSGTDYCSSTWTNPSFKCFQGGDFRTSENLALVGVQTLFLREHNRIANLLARRFPSWNDETLYQETRRIVIAELQHITYREYVPMIVGNNTLSPSSSYFNGYDANVNPQLTDEFSTAAFRMGHPLVRQAHSRMNIYQNNTGRTRIPDYNLFDSFFQSDMAYDQTNQGLNSIFLALLSDLAWKFGSFGNQMQNNLFQTTYPNGTYNSLDLFAVNLMRGRDHGLPTYVDFLRGFRGINIASFTQLSSLMNGPSIQNLQRVYADYRDIDLYAGGLLETIVGTNQIFAVGPTFGAIIMDQFDRLKRGDRFYYENGASASPYPFTVNQLSQIKTVTMAGLICRNYDIFTIQQNAFWVTNATNPIVTCSSLANQLDLSAWS